MGRTWIDRIVENPRTFNMQNNADGTITLIPAPGTIVQAGTPVNASNLNGIEADLVDYTKMVPYGGTTTGSANTYVISTPTISALTAGMAVSVKININSTGTSTLNWNGKGAKTIKKANGTNVTNLIAGGIYTLRYDGTNFILQGEGGSGNATASNLLSGKTASTDAGDITGTMPDYSNAMNSGYVSPKSVRADGGGSLVVEPYTGYYKEGLNGGNFGSILAWEPNLKAENIPVGKSMFGLEGTNNKKYGPGDTIGTAQLSKATTEYNGFGTGSNLSISVYRFEVDNSNHLIATDMASNFNMYDIDTVSRTLSLSCSKVLSSYANCVSKPVNGKVYCGVGSSQVWQLDINTKVYTQVISNPGVGNINNIVVDAQGNIYIAGSTGLKKFSSSFSQVWAKTSGYSTLTISNDNAILAAYDGSYTYRYYLDGTQLTNINGGGDRFISIVDNVLYVSSTTGLYMYNALTGTTISSKTFGATIIGGTVDTSSNVYILTSANRIYNELAVDYGGSAQGTSYGLTTDIYGNLYFVTSGQVAKWLRYHIIK